jgi:polyisoprenoid-binding protein YceI
MSMSSWDSNAVTGTKRRIVALVSVMLFASAALAKDAVIDVSKSNIVATFTQSGVPVDSPFTKFSGRIVYDAASRKPAPPPSMWCAAWTSAMRPTTKKCASRAGSTARSIHRHLPFHGHQVAGPEQVQATGKLTIKGRVLTINVPVTVATVGGAAAFDGSFTMSRKAFVIGDPAWGDYVEDKVVVKFRLVQGAK